MKLNQLIIVILLFNLVSHAQMQENPQSQSKVFSPPHLMSFYYNYKAKKALQNKAPEVALEYTLKILETDPESAQIQSNLGIIFDYLQKKDESEKSFQQSLKMIDEYKDRLYPADLFQIYYNLGVYFGAAKKIDQALDYYQRALDIDPSSMETKHNIELLIEKQQQQQNGSGEQDKKEDQSKSDSKDNKDQKDKNDQKKDNDKDKGEDKNQQKDQNKDRAQTPKYQPRPFKGEQLSEGDVKKILGELSEQDKKIRANFNKKDRKEGRHDKDW